MSMQFPSSGPTAAATALAPIIKDSELRCPFYCEENVWRLAYRKLHASTDNQSHFVAFISNDRKNVPMFHQLASESPQDTAVMWDYHVVLIGVDRTNKTALVYDVDTTLTPYPLSLDEYLRRSFSEKLSTYAPLFRVIPAAFFLQHFESDRSHMYNAHTREWSAPPPPYQCISPSAPPSNNSESQSRSNLKHYLNFRAPLSDLDLPAEALGTILSLQQLQTYNFT